jgi:glycerol-3-phosphate acyltransferase PlsY
MWSGPVPDFEAWPAAAWALLPASYFLGSIPFGYVLARSVKGIDVRSVGSGNIGATNTARAMGRRWGTLVGVLDAVKGFVPAALLSRFVFTSPDERIPLALLAGLAAVLGHCFPIWLRFKGGKGVATACGVILGVDPVVFCAGGLVWLLTLATTRFVGLSSLLMTAAFPIAAWWIHPDTPLFPVVAALIFLLILVRHRANLNRMIEGKEPRMGAGKAG